MVNYIENKFFFFLIGVYVCCTSCHPSRMRHTMQPSRMIEICVLGCDLARDEPRSRPDDEVLEEQEIELSES